MTHINYFIPIINHRFIYNVPIMNTNIFMFNSPFIVFPCYISAVK